MVRTTQRRKNSRTWLAIKVYGRIFIFLASVFAAGMIVGRLVTPPQVRVVTRTVEVSSGTDTVSQEVTDTVYYYDVPLSHELQEYIYEVCEAEDVPIPLVLAIIDAESRFDPDAVSPTDDYGLMQINEVNHAWLAEEYGLTDMLDPYQNIYGGTKMIATYIEKYDDYNHALMAYHMGEYGARQAWESGSESTSYSENVLSLMSHYEEVVENAGNSENG